MERMYIKINKELKTITVTNCKKIETTFIKYFPILPVIYGKEDFQNTNEFPENFKLISLFTKDTKNSLFHFYIAESTNTYFTAIDAALLGICGWTIFDVSYNIVDVFTTIYNDKIEYLRKKDNENITDFDTIVILGNLLNDLNYFQFANMVNSKINAEHSIIVNNETLDIDLEEKITDKNILIISDRISNNKQHTYFLPEDIYNITTKYQPKSIIAVQMYGY
jgi:hypothetical protein